jgi:uncharacterized membrane protein SpoIIM required for sporulation
VTELAFVRRRESSWREFGAQVSGNRRVLRAAAPLFVRRFRELTQDLNTARAHGFDPAIIERLNMLVNEGNQILYGQRGWSWRIPARFILWTFPRRVRSQWRGILAAFTLFYGLAFFFGLLCVRFPGMAAELVSEYQLTMAEEMYDPEGGQFQSPRDSGSDADMFGFYIYNNISIAFRTFAGGILAGCGSLLILCLNAVYLGLITGHIINAGYANTFFPFVIGHSAFELTAVVFSAYAGLLLGYRFFVTRGLSRSESLRRAGKDALPIIAGSTLMLVIAAAIEAFWSSRHELPPLWRVGVGAGLWLLLALYFVCAGRGNAAGEERDPSL